MPRPRASRTPRDSDRHSPYGAAAPPTAASAEPRVTPPAPATAATVVYSEPLRRLVGVVWPAGETARLPASDLPAASLPAYLGLTSLGLTSYTNHFLFRASFEYGVSLPYAALVTDNLAELLRDPVGTVCLYCCQRPLITEDADVTDVSTALCPLCGVDALVPSAAIRDEATLRRWHAQGFSVHHYDPPAPVRTCPPDTHDV